VSRGLAFSDEESMAFRGFGVREGFVIAFNEFVFQGERSQVVEYLTWHG
jgi:hypothetical protein